MRICPEGYIKLTGALCGKYKNEGNITNILTDVKDMLYTHNIIDTIYMVFMFGLLLLLFVITVKTTKDCMERRKRRMDAMHSTV